ncbi:unnamed protein product [Cylindrotheca closterium]|uniref:ATP-dependent transporter ycf16 n=1 Tax=Cylindrotheca closterium TaxID=2856 RepID=A0AAD2GCU6_9STRA|nr:unnamed protein product [Cylindrotheca closterium]
MPQRERSNSQNNGFSNTHEEFNTGYQKCSSTLSLINTLLLLVLGTTFVILPSRVVTLLLGNVTINDGAITIARMAGGVILAQGISCLVLLMIPSSSNPCLAIQTTRVAIAMQGVTGLVWVIIGLWNDEKRGSTKSAIISEFAEGDQSIGDTFGLLVFGSCVLFVACLALMLSLFPAEPRGSPSLIARNEAEARRTDMEEPLLSSREHTDGENPENNEHEPATTITDPSESRRTDEGGVTSRIRGTRRLLALAKPQTMYLYIGCLTLLVRLPFSLSIPHFVSTTLGALSQSEYERARREIMWLFLLGTIDACLDFWCIFWFGYANQRIVRGVRIDTFKSIMKQEIGYFDKTTSGELASRLNSDCGEMAGDLTWFFRFSIESVVRIIGITTYMLLRCPRLGACALSIIPVVAVVNKYYGSWLSKNARKVQDALAAANSVAQETFSCVRTVIAFASEEMEYNKYVEKVDEQYQLNVRQTYMTGIYYMFVSTFLINTVVQGSLLLYGSHLMQQDQLTGEVLLAFMLYQGQLQNEMLNLFQSYSSLIKSSGAGDKIFALLDRTPPPPGTGSTSVLQNEGRSGAIDGTSSQSPASAVSIRLKDVSFAYPTRLDHPVLTGLNLTIGTGQTVALVGASGCGKSTIVGLLQRFYDPISGEISINDTNIQQLDIKEHRRRIGVVTQDPTLFTGTILSNITYGLEDATMEEAIEAAKRANAHDFISSFPGGYDTEVGERGIQLSGGQKQRIAISRAIIRKPSLLLLDEATSALDAESEEIVQAALDTLLNENQGITTVIIAHRLSTVRNADMIAVVDKGQILESGSHEELMQQDSGCGYYKTMVQKSMGNKLVVP